MALTLAREAAREARKVRRGFRRSQLAQILYFQTRLGPESEFTNRSPQVSFALYSRRLTLASVRAERRSPRRSVLPSR